MPRGKDSKAWNEDLVEACRAREIQCRQQGKARQHLWRDAAIKLEQVRKDIYAFSNQRIVNLPKLPSKTAEEVCRRIILGAEPVYPPGYVPVAGIDDGRNPYLDDPYLKKIKLRSGAFAILMALHLSRKDVMTKEEICRVGAPWCDQPMMPNFSRGEVYAGWSSIATLERQHLVVRNSSIVYNERVGGLRNQGAHSFSLTKQGKQFIAALLETKMEMREFIQNQGLGIGTDYDRGLSTRTSISSLVSTVATPAIDTCRVGAAAAASTPQRSVPRVTPLMLKDEESLRSWAETARIGQQKEFKVGKDRRKHLHDVSDELNQNLRMDGRCLLHKSAGDVKARVLFVTVEAAATIPPPAWNKLDPVSSASTPPRKRLDSRFAEHGYRLGSPVGSPAKRARPIPPSQAAAQAALARHAAFEAQQPKSAPADFQSRPLTLPKPASKVETIDLTDDSPELDRKPPASTPVKPSLAPYVSTGSKATHEITILDESDDEEDKLPPPSCFATSANKSASTAGIPLHTNMSILIDSRERNRNATPRAMRITLTQMLSTGPLSLVWPKSWKLPTVEEATLPVGDFAFDFLHESGHKRRLPVYIERKVSLRA